MGGEPHLRYGFLFLENCNLTQVLLRTMFGFTNAYSSRSELVFPFS